MASSNGNNRHTTNSTTPRPFPSSTSLSGAHSPGSIPACCWSEFCEQRAQATADHFFQDFLEYLATTSAIATSNPASTAAPSSSSAAAAASSATSRVLPSSSGGLSSSYTGPTSSIGGHAVAPTGSSNSSSNTFFSSTSSLASGGHGQQPASHAHQYQHSQQQFPQNGWIVLGDTVVHCPRNPMDFAMRFVEHFLEHFEERVRHLSFTDDPSFHR